MKVLNQENRVSGPLSLLTLTLLLIGCSGGGPSIGTFDVGPIPPPFTTPSVTGVATSLYVVEQPQMKPGSILQFSISASGSAIPIATLNAPANLYVYSVATDSTGALYVGGNVPSAPSEILIYAANASGTATPYATIPGGDGSFADPQSMAFDTFGDLFVGGGNSCIAMFAPHSLGYQTPYGLIQGALTQIVNPNGIAVDKTGNVYVANGGPGVTQVLVFGPSARGNVAPTAILSGDQTTIGNPQGVATDLAGNLYVSDHGAILEFAPGATGNVPPIRTIGPGLGLIAGLRVDGSGNLYAVGTTVTGSPFALTFPATASGTSAPTTRITSNSWTSPGYSQLALY